MSVSNRIIPPFEYYMLNYVLCFMHIHSVLFQADICMFVQTNAYNIDPKP